jgi:hypothetical protein
MASSPLIYFAATFSHAIIDSQSVWKASLASPSGKILHLHLHVGLLSANSQKIGQQLSCMTIDRPAVPIFSLTVGRR